MFGVTVKSMIWALFSHKKRILPFPWVWSAEAMRSRVGLFSNNTTLTCRCAYVWIPAQKIWWSLWVGCKSTRQIYSLQCYRWHILWGWSRWTGPLCSGAFYRLSCWHNCIRGKEQNNQEFNPINVGMTSKSRAPAVNGTYLKSNLDVSKLTWTFWLSSTQNSTKTASLLSYHRAAACCALKTIRRKQMTW